MLHWQIVWYIKFWFCGSLPRHYLLECYSTTCHLICNVEIQCCHCAVSQFHYCTRLIMFNMCTDSWSLIDQWYIFYLQLIFKVLAFSDLRENHFPMLCYSMLLINLLLLVKSLKSVWIYIPFCYSETRFSTFILINWLWGGMIFIL